MEGSLHHAQRSTLAAAAYYGWKNTLGFIAHPAVAMNADPYALKIAHIGTGTSLWLLDLQQFLTKRLGTLPPTINLDFYDIDASTTPSSAWLPSNVLIKQLPLFDSEGPPNLHNHYDLIHLSNLAPYIKDNNPDQLVRNVFSML
ncbi:MAG: hypothetical protein LQ346_009041, partial [Caloplaca aetnensis]